MDERQIRINSLRNELQLLLEQEPDPQQLKINQLEARVAQLQRDYVALQSERMSVCMSCGNMFIRGDKIAFMKDDGRIKHMRCPG